METTTITKGPFAGESFAVERMVMSSDDGRSKYQARFADATQIFLEKFPPTDGWQLQVVSSMAPLDMPAYRSGDGTPCPAMFFQASLMSPSGVTIATASTLWVIDGPTAYEKGETNARLRLYQAAGLQTSFDIPGSTPQAMGASSGAPTITPTSEPERSYDRNPKAKAEQPAAAAPAASDEQPVQEDAQTSIPEAQAETTEGEREQPAQEAKATKTATPANPDAPSKSLLKSIETQCKMRGVQMPELATKADAMAFLKSLGSN